MTKYPELTKEQEQQAVAAGNIDLLVRSQIPWCKKLSRDVCMRHGCDEFDLAFSGGLHGLFLACRSYDGSTRLSYYCKLPIVRDATREIEKDRTPLSPKFSRAGVQVYNQDLDQRAG